MTTTTSWICTDPDTNQHCRRLTNTEYEFVQMESFQEDYYIYTGTVDIMDYFGNKEAQEELRVALGMYGYDSWVELEKMYGEDTFQIAAECIFETYMCRYPDHVSSTREEGKMWIEDYMTENAIPA